MDIEKISLFVENRLVFWGKCWHIFAYYVYAILLCLISKFLQVSLIIILLFFQPRVSRVTQDDSLTYAELELFRPRPEPPASSSPDPTPSNSDTVYAQILFQEKQL